MKKIILECGNEAIDFVTGEHTFTKTSHEYEVPDDFDVVAAFTAPEIWREADRDLELMIAAGPPSHQA